MSGPLLGQNSFAAVGSFDSFMALGAGGRIDFMLAHGEEPALMLPWARTARSGTELAVMRKVLCALFDDLALPFFEQRFIATIAASRLDAAGLRTVIQRLGLDPRHVSEALVHVSPRWPALDGHYSNQYTLQVIERLICAGADPTAAGHWKPFVHPSDVAVKNDAARRVLKADGLTELKVRGWLERDWLLPVDSDLIGKCWDGMCSMIAMERMAVAP